MPTEAEIIEAIRPVQDPELRRSIVDLGMVRDIAIGEHAVAFAFGNNQFTHDIIAKPETLERVASLLSDWLDRSVMIECQMGEHAKVTRKAITTTSPLDAQGDDPLVTYATTKLNAEVVLE